jgi:hypothetical protein
MHYRDMSDVVVFLGRKGSRFLRLGLISLNKMRAGFGREGL